MGNCFINYFNNKNKILVVILLFFIYLSGCSVLESYDSDSAPTHPIDLSKIKEPIPKLEPKSKYGNPDSYKVLGKRYYTMDKSSGFKQTGLASWYGTKFHGKRTSSGEPYNMYAMTGAHKTLPLPTYARVTNKANNKSIILKINDRGPFHSDRIIDLSYAAASKLGVLGMGTAKVELTAIDPIEYHATKKTENHDLAKQKVHRPINNLAKKQDYKPINKNVIKLASNKSSNKSSKKSNHKNNLNTKTSVTLAKK